MASEQFSLCWDNFHKNMSSGMNSLLENEDLVDVTLAVEGKYLKAHKMVLSVCSPYFKELFKTNPCQHPIVFMKDVSYVAISDLLQFMYQGEVQVSQENLTTFIKTAEALQIKGLTGDGNGSTDADVEPVPEKPTTHRAPEEYKPAARAKRQPAAPVTTPTPTVKRARLSASSSDSQPLPPVLTKAEPISSTPSTSEAVQFKMEPYDNSQSIDLADEGDDNFGDDTLDDNTVDDNEDYSMMEGTEGEPQAGTSADGAGEGQGAENVYAHLLKLVQSIDRRLTKNEKYQRKFASTENDEKFHELNQLLPVKDIPSVYMFDDTLRGDAELCELFKEYVFVTGGKNPKDNICRVLRKVFTNELGVHCSWLGLRGNFKMADRYTIKIIKDVVMGIQKMKENEFDKIASDWFRMSRGRLEREKK